MCFEARVCLRNLDVLLEICGCFIYNSFNSKTNKYNTQQMFLILGIFVCKFMALGSRGAGGGNCTPTFTKIKANLVKNRQISAKIRFLPLYFWILTPHFSVASEGPDLDILPLVVRVSEKHGAHREQIHF